MFCRNQGNRVCWIIVASLLVASVTQGQAKGPGPALKSKQIDELLKREIELKWEGEIPFKAFCEVLMKQCKGPAGEELRFVISNEAFKDEGEAAPDINDTILKFPDHPRRLPAGTALRLALAQVETRNATFLLRGGFIEITTERRADPQMLLGHPITARFEKRPFEEAIEELADASGATILIDVRIGEKAATPVSAFFRNTISLEGAVRLLAEMADLHAEVREEVLFITNKPRAEGTAKKAELRFRDQRLELALRELAVWSGSTIVLDPRYGRRSTSVIRFSGKREVFGFEAEERIDPLRLEPSQMIVSGTFKVGASPESASRILADQVGLAVVNLDNVLYVTNPSNAARLSAQKTGKFDE